MHQSDHRPTRILVVTPTDPRLTGNGGNQRTAHLCEAFARHGEVSTLVFSSDEAGLPQSEGERFLVGPAHFSQRYSHRVSHPRLKWACAVGLQYNRDKTQRAAVLQAVNDYQPDLIVYRYLTQAAVAHPASLKLPFIIDIDDRMSDKYQQLAKTKTNPLKRQAIQLLARFLRVREEAVLKRSSCEVFADAKSPESATRLYFPNIPWFRPTEPSPLPEQFTLGFIGNLLYRPNSDGLRWFLSEVWPQVLQAVPDCRFVLAGLAADKFADHPGVESLGFIDSVSSLYDQASLILVPIRYGGGSNIKLPEAMAHGRPCVATSRAVGAFGSDVEGCEGLLPCSDAQQMAEAIIRLASDREQLQRAAAAAKQVADAKFSPDRLAQVADKALRIALPNPAQQTTTS
ncbi:glycosyltransferase [Aeoliella mucimassa]|uniref:Putative glycosyl transferase n=1 Tax=Aeoliella mucimassa TaxID=2527972 RepID=A0A518AGV7_9BACT|nr:glycosyltransferase [Aeoliella mucimassa]QDU53961.1 putative glycosyl transferase [Aeoliella mucimassa]